MDARTGPVDHLAQATALTGRFAETDPERECWALRSPDRRVGFWHRRQPHETLVHLWDLRSAADPGAGLGDVDPAVCADGVDELFATFLPRAAPADLRELAGPLALAGTDVDRGWTVDPRWRVSDGIAAPAATVRAPPRTCCCGRGGVRRRGRRTSTATAPWSMPSSGRGSFPS